MTLHLTISQGERESVAGVHLSRACLQRCGGPFPRRVKRDAELIGITAPTCRYHYKAVYEVATYILANGPLVKARSRNGVPAVVHRNIHVSIMSYFLI